MWPGSMPFATLRDLLPALPDTQWNSPSSASIGAIVGDWLKTPQCCHRNRGLGRRRTDARKPALTKAPLEAMLATCTDGLIGLRDRALLLFAFASGGRRRSEVSAAVVEHLA